jgi:hypothetical protein
MQDYRRDNGNWPACPLRQADTICAAAFQRADHSAAPRREARHHCQPLAASAGSPARSRVPGVGFFGFGRLPGYPFRRITRPTSDWPSFNLGQPFRSEVPYGPFPTAPLRTGLATFTASGSPVSRTSLVRQVALKGSALRVPADGTIELPAPLRLVDGFPVR